MNNEMHQRRYSVSTTGGQRDGKMFCVSDKHTHTRVSFHRTLRQAQAEAKRLNRNA